MTSLGTEVKLKVLEATAGMTLVSRVTGVPGVMQWGSSGREDLKGRLAQAEQREKIVKH